MDAKNTKKIPKGYKETEVGIIPEEWEVIALSRFAKLINGRGFKPFEWDLSGLPIIRIQNLNGSDEYHYYSGVYDPKIEIQNGELLFAWSGSKGTSFGPHIWSGSVGLLNYHTWKIETNILRVDKRFFFHLLKKRTTDIENEAHGASALVHVQKWEVEKYQFFLPPLPEQRAIAEALSDTDELLAALDALIEKKRAIKRGAMQELLTGKRRLPGFSGKWEKKRLGEIGRFFKGQGIRKDQALPEGIPCIRYGEIYTHYDDIIRYYNSYISREVAYHSFLLAKGDLLFAGSGETAEEIGKCIAFISSNECYAGGDIVVLRQKEQNSEYLAYLLNTPSVNIQKARLGQGDAVVHISAEKISSVELHLPPLPEQSAIAAVLSDMDAEIEALEARREKTREIKRGMMQELLTGRIRLV